MSIPSSVNITIDSRTMNTPLDQQQIFDVITQHDRKNTSNMLFNSLAHRLKQPHSAALLNARLLQHIIDKDSYTPEQGTEFLEKIMFNIEKADAIIERTQDFINIKQTVLLPINVSEVIHKAHWLFLYDALLNKVEINLAIDEKPLWIVGDHTLIAQIIVNLYHNALHAFQNSATPDPTLYITANQSDNTIVICIWDNGPGMLPTELAQASNAFFTTHATGLGLGLTLVKEIVDLHNGSLTLSHGETAGVHIEIQFPMAKD